VPDELQAIYPTTEFDVLSDQGSVNWLYARVDTSGPPPGCTPSGVDAYTWYQYLSGWQGAYYIVSASFPYAAFEANFAVLGGQNYVRVRYWVGVMHWVALLGSSLPSFLSDTLGARVKSVMDTATNVQAWVNWKANPALHPTLGCEKYIEYLQEYPCQGMGVWAAIAGLPHESFVTSGSAELDVQISSASGPVGINTSGAYAENSGSGYQIQRPAFSFAGQPSDPNGLFSCMGRVVKAEVYVRCEDCDEYATDELDPSYRVSDPAGTIPSFAVDLLWAAARKGFECLFGGDVSAGVSVTYIPYGDTQSNTISARHCLNTDMLHPLDDVLKIAETMRSVASWLANEVLPSDGTHVNIDSVLLAADREQSE
jgi:hypothetical protein